MIVKRVELTQFRNYMRLDLPAGADINILYGANAQGKTNVLEAIYLCTCARSHRTARDPDLIYRGTDAYGVRLTFLTDAGGEETIEIRYLDAVTGDPQRGRAVRQVYHNGIKQGRVADLIGLFHAVIFAPEDLLLVKEGPSARRRYLDLLISQARPSYFLHLQKYDRFLQQRNRLLKQVREQLSLRRGALDDAMRMQLDVWNVSLAKEAAEIIFWRAAYALRIAESAEQALQRISGGSEKLALRYRTVGGFRGAEMAVNEIYQLYLERLQEATLDDLDKGATQSGPHRDDLELALDGEPLRPFASQGQQRSVVLALKLAELEILRQEIRESPVLLLDDVMSELDASRRASLLSSIRDAQVFLTCTDQPPASWAEMVPDPAGGREIAVFQVVEGTVTPSEDEH